MEVAVDGGGGGGTVVVRMLKYELAFAVAIQVVERNQRRFNDRHTQVAGRKAGREGGDLVSAGVVYDEHEHVVHLHIQVVYLGYVEVEMVAVGQLEAEDGAEHV